MIRPRLRTPLASSCLLLAYFQLHDGIKEGTGIEVGKKSSEMKDKDAVRCLMYDKFMNIFLNKVEMHMKSKKWKTRLLIRIFLKMLKDGYYDCKTDKDFIYMNYIFKSKVIQGSLKEKRPRLLRNIQQ